MTDALFDRLLLPVAEENDAAATCEAVRPYLESASEVVVVHVIEQTEGAPDKAPIGARTAQADEIFAIVRDQLTDADLGVRTDLRYGPDVVEEILDIAEEVDATAIGFTPRPGSRWIRLLSGGHADRLTTESDLPVLVFPHPEKETPKISETAETSTENATRRVLVPIDGSEAALSAVEHACSVYPRSDATVVHVRSAAAAGVYDSMTGDPSSDFNTEERRQKREVARLFEEAQSIADEYDVELTTLTLSGDVTNAILTCVEETGVDLIVMARRGRTGLKRRLLGGTTESVIRRSSVPVTVVR